MGLVFSDDGGWIAVDDVTGNYDHELQMEIDTAAQSSGVAQRDLAMDYRPTLTDTGYSFTPTIADPKITIANLLDPAAGTGRYVSDESATQDLMAAIQKAYAEGQVQLDPDPDPQPIIQTTGRPHGELSSDETMMWDASAMGGVGGWIPNPNYKPALSQAQTEAEQYLANLMQAVDSEGIPDNYAEHIRQLATDFQSGNLTQDQVQTYIDKLGTTAVGQLTDTNVASVEQFLDTVYDSFSPSGPGGKNPWFRKLGYTPMAETETAAADITKNIEKIAGGAQDVNGFIEGLLEGTMALGGTWAQTLDQVAQALIDNKSAWATGNDGAGYPGLSGQIDNLQNPESVKQWLHGIYAGFDDATKTKLVEAYPNRGPDLSNPYTTFAKAPEPVGTEIIGEQNGGITPTPSDGTGDSSPMPVDSPDGTPIPTTTSSGVFDPFVEDAQRSFTDVYQPFTMTQPGYNMPGIQRAYLSAGIPLRTQYSMQLPDLQVPGGVGLDPKYQTANEFLQSLTGGTGQILRGGDLYNRLQDISTALGSDPMQMGMDPRTELYQGEFGTTAQQRDAFLQPFLMATRGSPEARSALVNSVNQAAKMFDYQNPQGAPAPSGGRQGFLSWAMDNNLLGIKDMFNPNTMQEIERKRQLQQPSDLGKMGYTGGPGTGYGIDVWGGEG